MRLLILKQGKQTQRSVYFAKPKQFRHFFLSEKLQEAENERVCCSLGGNDWACCP